MTTVTRALQVNLGVFSANNNIRRSLAAFDANYVTANGQINFGTQTINPGSSWAYSPQVGSSGLVVQCSLPIRADISVGSVTVGTFTRPAGQFTTVINALHLLDDNVTGVVFYNPQSEPVTVNVVQG